MRRSVRVPSSRRLSSAAVIVCLSLAVLPPAASQDPAREAVFCPACGAKNRAASHFCLRDGTQLPVIDPGRYRPDFSRALETYSAEEVRQAIQRASASVVRIRGQSSVEMRYPVLTRSARRLFGRLVTLKGEERFAGSGFAVGTGGEIVTNAHVASPWDRETKLVVETSGGSSFLARIVGIDRASDLALLRIDTGSVPSLEWADSNGTRIGDEVWAIGNPLDLGITITRGTISSVARLRAGLNQVENFMHTDAFVTHGNSGGPLVDALGRVVGVNDVAVIQPRSHGYAIPSTMARLVIDRLRKQGTYERGFLGLHVRPLDAESIQRFKVQRRDGMVVEAVLPGTPASSAGFRLGDVLFGINGRRAASTYLLQEAVSSVGAGAGLTLSLERDGTPLDLKATTVARPEAPGTDALLDWERYLGARFEEVQKTREIVLRMSDAFSPARRFGFKDGDRLESVLPAQDWLEEEIDADRYTKKAHPVTISGRDDLHRSLARSYLGGRIGAIFKLKDPQAPLVPVVFDETLPIII